MTAPASTPANRLPASRQQTLLLSLLLAITTILVYWPVCRNSFIDFDDLRYIRENPHVTAGLHWSTVKWAFTSFDEANWHPLTWLSHALDCQIFGTDPAAHHFINLLFHAANAVLIFAFLRRTTASTWRGLCVAALFALHPLNVESVAWAAERKNVLSMFFLLWTLMFYAWYVARPGALRYAGVVVSFALALMSKPQVITLPFLLLLLDYWPLGEKYGGQPNHASPRRAWNHNLIFEKIPLFVLAALSAWITLRAQHAGHAVRTTAEYPLPARLGNAIFSYVRYLGYALFPRHLAPFYPHPANSLGIWKPVLCACLLIAVTLFVLWQRNRRYFLTGWFWYLGALFPMIGLVQVGEQGMADRYTYLPMLGVFIMAVWGVADVVTERYVRAVVALTATILFALATATYVQVQYWRNSETLWKYTLSVTQGNYMAESNLAEDLAMQGRVQEALAHWHRAESLHNYDPSQIIALGVYEQRNGDLQDAIHEYELAIARTSDPGVRSAAFANLGSVYLASSNEARAAQSFEAALRLNPANVSALLGSGVLAQRRGDLETAVQLYSQSARLQPNPVGYILLQRALIQAGRNQEANAAYQQASLLSKNLKQSEAEANGLLGR